MEEENATIKMNLVHSFGSTCSFSYNDAIAICSEDIDEPKLVFPAGKTMALKSIQRHEMSFIHFDHTVENVECIHILPTRTHVATSEKPHGSNLRVIRIYSIKGNEPTQSIKIFHQKQIFGSIKNLIFSASEPKFMCCLVGDPYNKLIYVDISKNKPLAQSNFTMKDADKITISPKNSHLICASGQSSIKIFKVEEYAFKPLDDIRKLPRNRKFLNHAWYRHKMVLAVTDKCQVLIIEEVKPNIYEVKQEYSNVFGESNSEKLSITAISTFSKGFILGSNNGKFCLWVRKEEMMNYEEEKLQLVRKWSTTDERASPVTGITVSLKEDILAVSLLNNDIATISLNDLLPQVKDLEKDKINKEIIFQYVYKGFHNNNITGMDLCQQRPLLATCSNEDSTIRIWNYKNFDCKLLRMFYYRVRQISAKPLISLGFHPFGYYLAVGCVDKLRFFYVLSNQLRPYREINIKGAHIVKFSHGGQFVVTASPVKQDFPEEVIHVFNAITLEQLVNFNHHQSLVKSIEWKRHDEYLCAVSQEGILTEWRVSDWCLTKKVINRDIQFECFTYLHEMNSIITFSNHNGRKFLQQFSCEGSFEDEIEIDLKVATINEISINKRSGLLLGLENGSLVVFDLQTPSKVKDIKNEHLKKINQIRVSPCNKYVMTCGSDCMIFIYKASLEVNGVLQEEDNNNVVDDFLADVVLFPKKQIKKYHDKEKELSKVLSSLERKLKYICEEGEKRHHQKVQDLQIQKNRVIDDLKYRIERIKEQIAMVEKKNQETLHDLDSKNFSQACTLEEKYQEKIKFEKQKFFQLEQQIIQEKMLHDRKLQQLKVDELEQIQTIKSEFKNKFVESETIYKKSTEAVNEATKLFDDKIKQVETEQEQELKQLQERLQAFKIQKATVEEELHQKLTKVKREHYNQTEERNQNKKKNEDLTILMKKMEKEVEQAKQKLTELKGEYDEKIETLKNKEEKIISFEKKVQDLQKKKHILSYKATEMKKALEPKQVQIEKLKLDLMKLKKQFDSSIQRKENMVLQIEKMEKEKVNLEKQASSYGNELGKKELKLQKLIYDIYSCVENNKNNPDSKIFSKEIVKLYHKYVHHNEKYQNNDQKGVEELTKQIVHLEKSLYQMNQSNDKNILRKNDEINKRIKENAELVNNLNQIKQQNQQTMRKIKAKNQDIDKLREIKGQMISQFKKFHEPHYQLSEDEESVDHSRIQLDRGHKLSLIDTIPREFMIEEKTSMKKKECEVVSEIEFLNEKIHKSRFFVKEIKDKIKKHFTLYKCAGETINIENDISEIK